MEIKEYEEQHDYSYFECNLCGFDSVQPANFVGSVLCPLCLEDCGHENFMSRRIARDIDHPEGYDARKLRRQP